MDRARGLEELGLGGQDWGPCYGNNYTHAEFVAAWRGTTACPTEAALTVAFLPAHKIIRSKVLQSAYATAMGGGFTSSALGAAHFYATDDDRKAILTAAALRAVRGLNQNYYCIETVSGIGAVRTHTPAQMLRVLDDAEAVAQSYLAKLLTKSALVTMATTEAGVNAIDW